MAFDYSHLVAAADRMQQCWQRQGIGFCFIGGLAVQHWGEPRMTQDIDASVSTGFGNESAMVERLLVDLAPRISEAADFAKLHRVLLGQEAGGVPVDVSLAGLPYEMQAIERARLHRLAGRYEIRLCSASDLVVLKAFADRPRDWQDIRGVLIRSPQELDWDLIETELTMLAGLKEEPGLVTRLLDLKASLD